MKMNIEKTGLYTFARVVVGGIYRGVFGMKARGVENFLQDENCIIFSNHISAWDPLTVAYMYKANEIHFIAKESLFAIPVLRRLLKRVHAFPVNRGAADMGAMRTAMQVLREGHVLGIFPEGTRRRTGHVEDIETGVAVLALKSGVPLTPVLIGGRYRPFGKLRAAVGAPVDLSDLREGRVDAEILDEVKRRLLDALDALRPLLDF